MKDKQLRQLLRDKLQNYEAPVPKGDWQAIADRLPSTATSADNHWRGLLHHKMASYTTPLPENDWHDNMLGRLPTPRKRRAVPLWVRYTIGLSAAAAVALLLLVPAAFPPSATEHTPLLADNTNTGETAVVAAAPAQTPTAAPATADTPSTPNTKRSAQTTRNTAHSYNTTKHTTDNADTAQPSEAIVEATPATTAGTDDTPTTHLPADQTPHISIEEAARLMREQQSAVATTDTAGTDERTPRESINLGILASLSPNVSEIFYMPSTTIAGSPIALRGTTTQNDRHDLPFSVGLSIGIPLCKRLDLQTGINYSYAHSRFTSTNRLQGTYSERNQQLHYIGVPLMLSFRIVDRRIIKFYVSAGGACEKGLIATQHRQTFEVENDALLSSQTDHEYIKGIQGSLTANVGLAVMFFKGMGIYFEPGFTWYIPAEKFPQPVNSRTVHPYNLSLTAGLRFNLK
ncbi:MAG: PorT family protein [Bacteroidales bacterium]|nr:PorT family protein [Bacteroidales bacterium]